MSSPSLSSSSNLHSSLLLLSVNGDTDRPLIREMSLLSDEVDRSNGVRAGSDDKQAASDSAAATKNEAALLAANLSAAATTSHQDRFRPAEASAAACLILASPSPLLSVRDCPCESLANDAEQAPEQGADEGAAASHDAADAFASSFEFDAT